ncbi:MAG TPA: hypothetical protein VGV37_22835 [Aliidongia sp.]|uniref:hypothetical protein n=1 Tax=Aliidongia sp. TaxID=1914230 RepID=UPI002DDCC792|nr:hypothetical protein [Aliidongia sp.]HEV2677383.1 hypothetical protein [Aliidongia sp.]
MRTAHLAPDPSERDHQILTRMLSDAESLCRSQDALLVGQYCHLRGRIAALIDLVAPIGAGEARS